MPDRPIAEHLSAADPMSCCHDGRINVRSPMKPDPTRTLRDISGAGRKDQTDYLMLRSVIRASANAAMLAHNAGTAAAMNRVSALTWRASMIAPINGPMIDPIRPMPSASRRRSIAWVVG